MALDLDPLDLLRTELKENDYEAVIKTISKLTIIGLALGPERTRKELLPFLKDYAEVDNDEAQAGVAAQLADFVPLVGGPDHAPLLLPLLENMCSMEETVIREAAVASCNRVISQLPPPEISNKVFPMIKRLANGDWFYSRMSAAGLCAVSYPALPDEMQKELLSIFSNLCNDDTPMVRKATYQCLGPFAIMVQKDRLKEEILPILQSLAQDDLDSMRIHAIEACATVAQVMDEAETDQLIIPVVTVMHEDPSWRVRQQYCKSVEKLTKNVGPELSGTRVLPGFVKLLRDHELAVRLTAANLIHKVAANCKSGLLENLVPAFDELMADDSEKVRVAFSASLIKLCNVFGTEIAQKLLVPYIQNLAKDQSSDVRSCVISNLHIMAQATSPVIVDHAILPILTELSKDTKWRVRLEVTGKLAFVAQQLASVNTGIDVIESKLMSMLVNGLTDHVYSIRERACDQVAELTQHLGVPWATAKLFPVALAVFEKSTNYLHRMTSLIIVKQVVSRQLLSPSEIEKHFLPLVLSACKDPVANVRLAAGKTLQLIVPVLPKPVTDANVKPLLMALTKDVDVDVKYFAEEALKLCSE